MLIHLFLSTVTDFNFHSYNSVIKEYAQQGSALWKTILGIVCKFIQKTTYKMNRIRAFLFRLLGTLPYPIICWAVHGGLQSVERIANWVPLDYLSTGEQEWSKENESLPMCVISVFLAETPPSSRKILHTHTHVAKALHLSFTLYPLNLCIVPYSFPGHTVLVI